MPAWTRTSPGQPWCPARSGSASSLQVGRPRPRPGALELPSGLFCYRVGDFKHMVADLVDRRSMAEERTPDVPCLPDACFPQVPSSWQLGDSLPSKDWHLAGGRGAWGAPAPQSTIEGEGTPESRSSSRSGLQPGPGGTGVGGGGVARARGPGWMGAGAF